MQQLKFKKITYILILSLLITSLPLDSVVFAANEPEITSISLIGVTDDGDRTLMYQIYGKNFVNPEFWVDGKLINKNGYQMTDDGSYLIINNSTNNDIFESDKTHTFKVRNDDGTESLETLDFTVKLVPWVTSVSKSKAYIGDSLTIYGTGIDDDITKVVIGGNPYSDTEFQLDSVEQKITIPSVKPAQFSGLGDIKLIKEVTETNNDVHEIQGVYKEAVIVVGKLEGVEVSRVEPNAGSVFGGTRVRILGVDGKSNFREDMQIYIDKVSPGNKFADIELFYDDDEVLRGISGVTPKSPTSKQGVFDIIITDFTNSNELVIPNAYTYEDKENLLRLSNITPPYGKEASVDETVEITGRNIATLNLPNLIEWQKNKTIVNGNLEDKDPYFDYENKSAYIINYVGKYRVGESEVNFNVNITREIKLILGKTTEITSFTNSPTLDRVTAKIPSVDEPGAVTVTMQTTTTVTDISGEYILSRNEEYSLANGFTFLPATTTPIIESIEPSKGPIDELIYLTIKGKDFQVLYKPNPNDDPENPDDDFITIYPKIQIGSKIINPNEMDGDDQLIGENIDWVEVYDEFNNKVNGIGRILGTTIRTAIPAHGTQTAFGLVDVIITNPDSGQSEYTDDPDKKFEFLKHNRTPNDMPVITKITPDMGPIEGGNTITIEGRNFAFQQPVPDVLVTIDGQVSKIITASSSKITAIVPPGITIGEKPVQVITEDGAMDTINPNDPDEERQGYTYIRLLANPQIEAIAPSFGGEGTIVYIFGKDKGIENPNFFAPDTTGERIEEKIGTRVFLNGIDINEDKYYMVNDEIADTGNGVVFENGLQDSRVQVLDRNTLRIEIPGGFAPGPKSVTILNPDTSTTTKENGFNYKKPPAGSEVEITSIEPNLGSSSGGDYVTIFGNNFKDGAKVYFGGKEATEVVVSATRDSIYLKTPSYTIPNPDIEPSKQVDVTVVNYDGSSYTSTPQDGGGYTYMVPQSEPIITSLTPTEGTTIGGEYVTIVGRDFRTYLEDGIPKPPKVYFGGIEAKEVIYMRDTELYVVTPFYGGEGSVDVTVVNPGTDFGVFIKKNGFNYRMTKPIIQEVFPDKGHKLGGQEITIKGKELLKGDFSEELKNESLDGDTPVINVLATFGDEKDSDRVIPKTIDGEIQREGKNILGELTIDYKSQRDTPVETHDGDTTTDSVLIYHENIEKPIAHYDLKPDERHLFLLDWRNLLEEEIAPEAMMVELRDDTLTSKRRIAPRAEILDAEEGESKTVLVQTPPAAYIGSKNLYIENKDRGWASTKFEYVSPDSKPVIETITPRSEVKNPQDAVIKYLVESTIEGGLYVTIEGYDFRQGVEVFIDGTPAVVESRVILPEVDDEGRAKTRILAKIPKGNVEDLNKEKRIMVVNADSGFADSTIKAYLVAPADGEAIPYYFVYRVPESKPYIESILPVETSQAGGNKVRIMGYDFRSGAKVLIDGKECAIDYLDNDEIVIITPPDLKPGVKDVQVINRDYGAMTKNSALKVVSYPIINQINTEGGEALERVSIEGDQVVVIAGRNFHQGAKVIIGGTRKIVGATEAGENKGLFADDKYYVIENGYPATKVEYVDENKLIVTIPEVFDEDDYVVSIINPDGGLSNDDKTISYTVPIPSDPVGLKAEIVNDKYIRIYDYTSVNASYYEIYAYIGKSYPDDDELKYLDTTEKTSYRITKFDDISKNENIYIRIRAVNKYGPSEWSDKVRISYSELKDLDGIGDEDKDGDLTSNYKETITSEGLNILLGDKLSGSSYSLYTIDLRDAKYKNINKRIVNIPRRVIRDSSRTILMDNGDSRIQFSPYNFIFSVDGSDTTYGKIIVDKLQGIYLEQISIKIPRKYKAVSKVYSVQTAVESNRSIKYISNITGTMDIEISYDELLLNGIDESKLQIYKFDTANDKWIPLPGGLDKERNRVHARVNGPGEFVILGER